MKILITCLVLVHFAGSVAATSDAGESLEISLLSAESDRDSSRQDLLISLYNKDELAQVRDVTLRVGTGSGQSQRRLIGYIAPRNSCLLRLSSVRRSNLSYVMAQYRFKGRAFSEVRMVKLPPVQANVSSSRLPASFVGFIGVAMGAILTSFLTSRRDRERATQDWAMRLFEENAKNYQRFVSVCAGVAHANLLQEGYRELEESSWIPGSIRTQYRETIEVLRSRGTSEDQKSVACKRLLEAIERYRLEPWKI